MLCASVICDVQVVRDRSRAFGMDIEITNNNEKRAGQHEDMGRLPSDHQKQLTSITA